MKTLRLTILLAAGSFVAASAIADLPKGYETLARKSIFSRDRTSRVSSRPAYTPPPPPPPAPVVTGIVREETGTFVAVIETPGAGRPLYLRVGDALPGNRGIVTEMNLDCFVFVPALAGATTQSTTAPATPRKAFVGRNLDGSESTLTPSAASSSTTDPASIQGDDVISRMRRRRLEGR